MTATVEIAAVGRARAVHPWQHRIALAALILPLPVVVDMLRAGLSAPALIVPVLLSAVPPALRANRAWFMTACVALAVLLLGWSLLGLLEGMWIFLPSALLLLCANFADPRAYRIPATVFTALATIIAVVPLVLFGGSLATLLGV
ncbi:hypothetical protein J7F03_09035 [Streptomyces sp. ISL-43]|uniref:hypothetical protein n=1 Tax=Streptomyces sp. ISL-43 TaxID=2819183 RepID=UPI001BE9EBE9|nr:hypothetical protein [Streptomyces sp. ISL-43]MBT2447219.1 hypothetical protein [Streptomyces sp. ISL-43]